MKTKAHFTISEQREKEISFRESLVALRKEREMTVAEIAKKVGRVKRTVDLWMAGTVVPPAVTQHAVLALLSDPNAEPSARVKRRVAESHHLIWDKAKGWEMRVTVDVGKKVVGKRIRERLKTKNLAEAIARRDLIVANMKRLGLTIRDRRQRRTSCSDPSAFRAGRQ